MTLYHEIPHDSLAQIMRDGLKRSTRGEKGDDDAIATTDRYLDDHRPAAIAARGIHRNKSIYAFLGDTDHIIDITNGATLPLADYPLSGSVLLRLDADMADCYVSDLDSFDAVKSALTQHDDAALEALAARYWAQLTPLSEYVPGAITRPEVMITTDLAADRITRVAP